MAGEKAPLETSYSGFEHGKNPSPYGRNDGWSDTYAGRMGIPPGAKDRTREFYVSAPQGARPTKRA